MAEFQRIAYELGGEIMCEDCYYDRIEKEGRIVDEDDLITIEKRRLRFGNENQAECTYCEATIVYEEA